VTNRSEPDFFADERTMLAGWLDYHRATLAWKCDGLSDEQMRTASVPPSGLSLLGLVRHMVEVERQWFRAVIAGEDVELVYSRDDRDGDFNAVPDADPAADLARWRDECARSRQIYAELPSLDATGSLRGEPVSARWAVTHMIEEYARHNGHADLVRERIDGSVGD
jgi:uncharacterized damage-inducible protein DinB